MLVFFANLSEVAQYQYKSTMHPCMEHCFHVWAGTSSWHLEFATSVFATWNLVLQLLPRLNPWLICRNVANLRLFCRYYFDSCLSELAQLAPVLFSWGRSTLYSDGLYDFPVTIPRCYKDFYVKSLFPCTARLWNSLPIEYFTLTNDLNGFNYWLLELTGTY